MGGGLLKTIVIFIVLATLAFVAGSLAADGAKQALMPALILLGAFALLYLGKNCWWLVFLVPPVMSALQISMVKNFPVEYFAGCVILVFWILMTLMGYVRITWNGMLFLDITSLLFFGYFIVTWVMHPVTLNMLIDERTMEGETMIGGTEYVWCLASIVIYILISIIPVKTKSVITALKITFFLSFVVVLYNTTRGVAVHGYSSELAATERYSPFGAIGFTLYTYICSKYSVLGIVASPWKLVMLVMSTIWVCMSGFREQLLKLVIIAFSSQIIHRQLIATLVACLVGYGALLYLSAEEMLDDLPHGVKRVLTAVPGVEVKEERIERGAQHSLEWRFVMWRWALTPSMGYIKDYVWGDGFGTDTAKFRWNAVKQNRRIMGEGDQRFFAEMGKWHSGPITALHRTGGVGLFFLLLWNIAGIYCIFRVCFAYFQRVGYEYVMYALLPVVGNMVLFYISAGSFPHQFGQVFSVVVAKVLYSLAIKDGLMQPAFSRREYVPLIFEESIAARQGKPENFDGIVRA